MMRRDRLIVIGGNAPAGAPLPRLAGNVPDLKLSRWNKALTLLILLSPSLLRRQDCR